MEKIAELRHEMEVIKAQEVTEGTGKFQIGPLKDSGAHAAKKKKDLYDRNVVNPHSMKRKKATGIDYDDDSDD